MIRGRLAGKTDRPLFHSPEQLAALYAERAPFYRMADVRVSLTGAETVEETADRVLDGPRGPRDDPRPGLKERPSRVRYLILSDIHSNDEALAAVLARVRRKRFDRVVVLGDFVGYGANPNQVIDRIRRIGKEKVMIRGNHDKVVCGLESGDLFNPVALKAARWTTEKLTPRNRKFLEDAAAGPRDVDGAFAICHGSPRDEDAYIFTDYDAYLNFRELSANVCFFGHSHIPSVFTLEPHGILVELVSESRVRYPLRKGLRYLINPGSIGQPRDRNAAASYAIYDAAAQVVHFDRVTYPAEKARDKIYKAGLPHILGDRLLVGA